MAKKNRKQRMMARQQGTEQAVEQTEDQLANPEAAGMTPAEEMQLDNYSDNATLAVYSKKTQPTVLNLLQSGTNPIDSLSRAAFFVHNQLEGGLRQKGEHMTYLTLFFGAAHLVSELSVLAEAAKIFTLTPKERMDGFKGAIKMYFEAGLKIFKEQGRNAPGAIDPVILQKEIEPLLTDKQREMGMQMADKEGISKTEPGPIPIQPQQPAQQTPGQPQQEMPPQGMGQAQQQPPQGLMAGGM